MIGFEHAVWLKIATGTPPGQAIQETMAAFNKAEECRAQIWREYHQARRRDFRAFMAVISCVVGVTVGLMVLAAYYL